MLRGIVAFKPSTWDVFLTFKSLIMSVTSCSQTVAANEGAKDKVFYLEVCLLVFLSHYICIYEFTDD